MIGRRGFTLIELLVAVVLASVIGAALVRLIVNEGRFTSQQDAIRGARAASRSALNVLLSELRMVEVSGGVVSAAPRDITIRVPFVFGVVCDTSGGATHASILPVDSTTLVNAGFSGYAWMSSSGDYTYEEVGPTVGPGTGSVCTTASVTTLTGGRVVALTPPTSARAGTPVFLFQRLRYEFKNSTLLPGRISLWRTVVRTAFTEELVAPFDSTARFRFYVLNAGAAQDAAPSPLNDLRGLQLVLDGASVTAPPGSSTPKIFDFRTAVFFKNRRY